MLLGDTPGPAAYNVPSGIGQACLRSLYTARHRGSSHHRQVRIDTHRNSTAAVVAGSVAALNICFSFVRSRLTVCFVFFLSI